VRGQPCGPGRHEIGQYQTALKSIERRRDLERRGPTHLVSREGEFILIDGAESYDTWQQDSVGVQNIEEDFARHAAGAPRWQVQRNVRETVWICARVEAINELAVDES
jgi:hypothetical protein